MYFKIEVARNVLRKTFIDEKKINKKIVSLMRNVFFKNDHKNSFKNYF